ncbi:chromatin assembly factor 1 subunit A-A-like [Eurytemora carolleeae]|uniref:chromatin assembly factor 1 subunit A-A-like n=1 Tax=Eurytemora carolleeae TaxID=1294199 RepID=UPI000C769F17|nr:chromatin assembly factor 1 subunit A-A-like [Eurytemora carolleeae]|eukprot:XP_023324273.1 chromatin assembly factor 1 subunit A-A-like [Eurytemora affinis]
MAESKSLPSDVKKISKNEEELKILEVLKNTFLLNPIPWQKRKSGKFWKTERSQFRALKKDKGQRRTFEERLKLKEERIRNNELGNMLMKEKIAKKQDLRQRIAENKKKKEEKQLKNEVYQVVRNPNKIKKMKKSDLVKRDILAKVQ